MFAHQINIFHVLLVCWLILRLRMKGYGWPSIIPPTVLIVLGNNIEKPKMLGEVIFWIGLTMWAWLSFTGGGGGGSGPRKLRPKKKERADVLGLPIPA